MASKRTDGRYQVSKVINGKRKYFYGTSKKNATEKMQAYIAKYLGVKYEYSEHMTIRDLGSLWLRIKANEVRKSTLYGYRQVLRSYIVPNIGDMRIFDVTSATIRNLLDELSSLSPRTQQYTYTIINAMLEQATLDEFIPANPCKKVKKPKNQRVKTISVLSKEELAQFMEGIENQEHYMIFKLAFATGLRRSELLGLRWSDINFDKAIISVNQTVIKEGQAATIYSTTKTSSSRRNISIDSTTLELLKKHEHLINQKRARFLNWKDIDLVFPNDEGNPRAPDSISELCKIYANKINRPDFTFHCIRHTHATLLIESGANFKSLQARLGHSSFNVTMNIYSHVTTSMDDDLIEKIESIF